MLSKPAPEPGTSTRWLAGFAAAWVLLAVLGRLLVVGEAALVWPALGLSITWFLVRRARLVSIDTAVLAVAAFATIAAVGAPLGVACLGALTNCLQAPCAAALIRRWLPALDPIDGIVGLDSPRDLLGFSGAVLAPAVLAAVVALVGLVLLGHPVSGVLGLLLVGRNLCGGLLAATLSLTVVAPLLAHRRPEPPDWRACLEMTAAVAVALGLLLLDALYVEAPVGFLVLAVAVWVGARGSVAVNVWFASAVGVCVVLATLAGDGTFSSSSTEASSLLAQLFVTMVFGVCLALATGRSETRRLQVALREAAVEAEYRAEFLNLTMSAVHEGIMVVDGNRAVTFFNAEAVRLLGLDEQTGSPRLPTFESFLVDGVHLSELDRPLARALRGEDVQDVEAWLSQDPPRVVSIGARQLTSTDGRGRRAVLTVRDITGEHVQRTALKTFAGVVAHDLQNPLAAIDGWAEMLAHHLGTATPPDEEALRHLARISASSARMSGLISELLAYATVKDKALSPEPVELAEVVAHIAHERGLVEQISCGPVPPLMVDPTLTYQLFDNLIGNAVKFVAPGVVPNMSVEAVQATSDTTLVTLEVRDNGIGIPDGLHEDVFSEFRRVHGPGHRGHGLGLAICRRIVTRHGGTISAHDGGTNEESGTTFRLTLPVHLTDTSRAAPDSTGQAANSDSARGATDTTSAPSAPHDSSSLARSAPV